ncbi:MAG: (d)CMP kinase [Salibacteraceae bacterium]|nr:(d)CMP kinase [Salibacteraceae bacterium]
MINIAIDGYAGCGKSTLARDVAAKLGFTFIDTGALYRGITLFVTNKLNGIVDDQSVLEVLSQKPTLVFEPLTNHLLLNNINVETQIRSAEIASKVSQVAALPSVRHYLLNIQRDFIQNKGVVMEGRDIGTVIMPDAEAKFFITANMQVRVERRFLQLKADGKEQSRAEVEENLSSRDYKDATRSEAPLKLASDAVVIDTSHLTREEQVKCIIALTASKTDKALLPFV